jgi:toxin HigB-1
MPLNRGALHDTIVPVIRSFQHRGLERFFETGSKAGIQPKHANRLRRQLTALDNASMPRDMDLPGYRLHELKGSDAGEWAVGVNGNWRMTFRFEGADAILVNYQDYH